MCSHHGRFFEKNMVILSLWIGLWDPFQMILTTYKSWEPLLQGWSADPRFFSSYRTLRNSLETFFLGWFFDGKTHPNMLGPLTFLSRFLKAGNKYSMITCFITHIYNHTQSAFKPKFLHKKNQQTSENTTSSRLVSDSHPSVLSKPKKLVSPWRLW